MKTRPPRAPASEFDVWGCLGSRSLDARLSALVSVLVTKGVLTEAELAEALRKGKP